MFALYFVKKKKLFSVLNAFQKKKNLKAEALF